MRNLVVAILATVALAAVGGPVRAQMPPNIVIEASIETMTDQVIFPSTLAGRVQVRNCAGCLHASLQFDANTQFNLAGQKLSLKQMAAYAGATRGRPLTIHYRLRDLVVSLVSVVMK